jgi:hypothetical protein
MTDHGHELLFDAFLPPDAGQASAVLALSRVVEELELDVLAFQDHPYQPGFLDLEEAVTIIRRLWTPGPPVHFSGRWYRLEGARTGPAPAHPIGIWLGAHKRRMLELTGRLADGPRPPCQASAWGPNTPVSYPWSTTSRTVVATRSAVGTTTCSRLAANGRGTLALATRRMGASRS